MHAGREVGDIVSMLNADLRKFSLQVLSNEMVELAKMAMVKNPTIVFFTVGFMSIHDIDGDLQSAGVELLSLIATHVAPDSKASGA